jgi:glycosyltransferase involved in cell wall biosynthesis
LVREAIDSALRAVDKLGDGEVVVVDDGSTDNTIIELARVYAKDVDSDRLKLVALTQNVGVSKARNIGIAASQGKWVIFLDSDDIMQAGSETSILWHCERYKDASILFFRCRSMSTGQIMGRAIKNAVSLDVRDYLTKWHYGECLPVVRKSAICEKLYDETLSGWEGLAYARLLAHGGYAVVVPEVVRMYRTTGNDRLSSKRGIRKRAMSLAKGHRRMLFEFLFFYDIRMLAIQAVKATVYTIWACCIL